MRYLITGGDGDIAKAIAEKLEGDVYAPNRDELDVSNIENVYNSVKELRPDVVINCAGYIKPDKVKESNQAEWIRQISVNLVGTYLVSKNALENGAKVIINISSTSGMGGRGNWSAYCASKAGVISFTQSLAEEGVRAYCISPHRTKSKMRKYLFPDEDQETLMTPDKVADVVLDVLKGKYNSGVNIELGKDLIKTYEA